jgi:hypothetical protein
LPLSLPVLSTPNKTVILSEVEGPAVACSLRDHLQTLGCPILSPPDRATGGETNTPSSPMNRLCFCFWVGPGFSLGITEPLQIPSALPEAGAKRLIYRFCRCFCLCFRTFPAPPNYFSRIYSAKSHVKPPNPPKNQ